MKVNKALLYKDWKYGKWFFPILSLELFILFSVNLISYINTFDPMIMFELTDWSDYVIGPFVITITLVFMSNILFSHERKVSTYTFATSLPFKREEIITSKWMVGAYNIILSYFVVYIIMNTQLILNYCWDRYFTHITIWSTAGTSCSILIFSFIMLIQSMTGSTISGSLLVMIFGAFPFTLVFLIFQVFNNYNSMRFVSHFLGHNDIKVIDNVILSTYKTYSSVRDWSGGLLDLPFIVFAVALILLMISYVFFRLSRKLFVKNCFERVGKLTIVPKLERFVRPMLFYYLGFMLTLISAVFLNNTTKYFFRIDIVILLCLILPILLSLSYKRISKINFRLLLKRGYQV
ncbi:MAG TPA: hypothetical protein VIO64_10975 [Pseudobacteroides sp.]|uniref:ABC-2 transporter permease n=1 Tax=Pseudobacteroides sp. TaxID=1968840 RepID=UPI002F9256FD